MICKVKVKDQIMYFLVNAYPPELLDIATIKFCRCIDHRMWRVPGTFLCDLVTLTPRSRSYNVFSCKCIASLSAGRSNFKFCRRIGDVT